MYKITMKFLDWVTYDVNDAIKMLIKASASAVLEDGENELTIIATKEVKKALQALHNADCLHLVSVVKGGGKRNED